MLAITDKAKCCGCNACVQICPQKCIEMNPDSEGFLYPKTSKENCIQCGLCERVCPLGEPKSKREPKEILAATNKNEHILDKSSSGGVFYELALETLAKNGVVFGAMFDKQWNVKHSYVENISDLEKILTSKYVQSEIGDTYTLVRDFLKQGREVLFCGTPCQIAGLTGFLRNNIYSNLIIVDFLCHGVPSPKVWKLYLNAICKKPFYRVKTIEISTINFRSKNTSWRNFSFLAIQKGGKLLLNEQHCKNAYMQGFLNDLYLRPSCHECKFKRFQSQSDLTLADYWGIARVNSNYDNKKGVSMVFINTTKGESLLHGIKDRFKYIQTSFEDILSNNGLNEHTHPHPQRAFFFANLTSHENNIIKLINKCIGKSAYKNLLKKVAHKLHI